MLYFSISLLTVAQKYDKFTVVKGFEEEFFRKNRPRERMVGENAYGL